MESTTVEIIIRAINSLGKYIQARPCLSKAITAKLMFARRRYPVEIRIGISKTNGGETVGHAWVEKDGVIIIGGDSSISRYVPINYNMDVLNRVCPNIK